MLCAQTQLLIASRAASNRYDSKRLRFLADGLKGFRKPLGTLADLLGKREALMLFRRPPQTELLIDKLREARASGKALELPDIMRLGIAEHGARLKEIRNRGFQVINELESVDGVWHSRYWLLHDPERDGVQS